MIVRVVLDDYGHDEGEVTDISLKAIAIENSYWLWSEVREMEIKES
jgi:hypothetical protein